MIPRHPSHWVSVGCLRKPGSHTCVCSQGFTQLPP
ncbi:hypothetical protein ACFPL2_23565 [Rahnella aquatilis]